MIPKRQSGIHTWDMNCTYHRCPKCGFILENRDDYEYQLGKFTKQLKCDRCQNEFSVEKIPNSSGPIFGR